jgi:hypothetical protein
MLQVVGITVGILLALNALRGLRGAGRQAQTRYTLNARHPGAGAGALKHMKSGEGAAGAHGKTNLRRIGLITPGTQAGA